MEKKLKCKICEHIIKEEEHETGMVSFCNCQNDLSADFDKDKWIAIEENEDLVIGETEKLVDRILKTMDLDKEGVEDELRDSIKKSRDMFDIVDDYNQMFIRKDLRSMEFYYEAQDRLTGVYMYLTTITHTMESVIEKQSTRRYHFKKLECAKSNEKFVSASTEKECSFFVSDMKIFLSIFEGYLDSCKQGIQTCRRRIAYTENEKDYAK